MRRLTVFSLLIPALAAALAAVSAAQEKSDAGDADESAKPKTHTVEADRLRIELELDGTFESGKSVALSLRPKSWSKLEVQQAVPHGSSVKEGKPVVTLDLDDLDRAIKEAEQAVELGRLSLDEAKVSVQALEKTTPIDLAAAERNAQNAQEDLEYFLETDKERSIKSAEYSLRSSRYRLEYAEEELDQLQQMYKADDLTEETEEIILKRAERDVDSARFSLELAELRTKKTLDTDLPRREQTLIDSTKREQINLAKARTTLEAALRKAEIGLEKQQIEFNKAKERLDELQADQRLLKSITAPIDGYVYYGEIKDGKWGGPGKFEAALRPGGNLTAKQVFMTIVSPGAARIRASVDENELYQVRAGVEGQAVPTAFPEMEFPVKVESVSRIPAGPGKFDCVIGIGEGDTRRLFAGMGCKATLTTYDRKNAVTVPKSAVFTDDDTEYVYVLGDEGPTKRTVKTGRTSGEKIEIKQGLQAGDEILLEEPKDAAEDEED